MIKYKERQEIRLPRQYTYNLPVEKSWIKSMGFLAELETPEQSIKDYLKKFNPK